ncbi:MAG: response regulator transcription factor [Streptosporangiaceae bacterium]
MQPELNATRVVLAEDAALLREGLAVLLERFGFHVAAITADADGLRAAVDQHHPDLVITDIRMPPTFTDEGLRAAVTLRHDHPGLAVVVLSQYVQHGYATDLLDSGDGRGVGYLLKDRIADVEDFITTLRRVAAGGTAVDPQVISQLVRRRRDPLATLSTREREVLALIAEGHSNAAIARKLFITEAAVSKHVGNILAKLRLPQTNDTNRRVLAVLAYLRHGG